MSRTPAAERFARKVTLGPAPKDRPSLGPCHIWTGSRARGGYGAFMFDNQKVGKAHRWAYEQWCGEIPEGHVIDHLCRIRTCVNPAHLEPVTHYENLRRGAIFGLRNGMRDQCIHGHKYTPQNTYITPATGRIKCKECARIRDRKRNPRKAAA